MQLLRLDTARQPVWLPGPDGGDAPPTPRRDERFLEHVVVDSDSRADRLSLADGVDSEAVESFLGETDFDDETILVETVRVEECLRLELCHVSWQPGELSTDYTRRTRPYDEHCRVDEWVFEVRLIRLPEVVDADRTNAFSSSIGSGPCRRDRPRSDGGPPPSSGDTTPAGVGTTTPTGTHAAERDAGE